jgi:hypothetical protein
MASCIFHHISLDREDNFDALSYSWERNRENRLMRVNGHSFQVARTLEGALVQFRRDLSTCVPGGAFDYLETLARSREEPSRS